jgi:AraC-like DNA-binding protein
VFVLLFRWQGTNKSPQGLKIEMKLQGNMQVLTTVNFQEQEFPTTHISILYRWLMSQGYSRESILGGPIKLDSVFESTDHLLSFKHQQKFINYALNLTKNELLGFELGQHIGTHSSGLIGYAVKCSPTLDIALDTLSHYFQLRNTLFSVEKNITRRGCLLTFQQTVEFGNVQSFLYLMFVGACLNLFKSTSNYFPAIKAINLMTSKPDSWKNTLYPHVRFNFNAPMNNIAFDIDCLYERVNTADLMTLENLQDYFKEKLRTTKPNTFINQVRNVLAQNSHQSLSQNDVALILGISPRSLRRKFQEANLTFKEINSQLRAEKATSLLSNKKLRIYQISEMMGYNNISNFRRAFKNWTGKSFKDYR